MVDCDDKVLLTRVDAVRALVSQPRHCTDIAIEALQRFSETEPEAKSDLAGAYYVRAQNENRPADLLKAARAAMDAVAARPQSAAAHFNRALILEAIGLTDDAIASWTEAARLDDSPWSLEARERRDALEQKRKRNAETEWSAVQTQLDAALLAKDETRVAKIIAPFPSSAVKYFEEVLLPRGPSAAATTLANALSKHLQGDRFELDLLESPRARALWSRYQEARRLANTPAEALAILDSIEGQARARRYRHFGGRILMLRAHCLSIQSQYLDSLVAYDGAQSEFARLGDAEGVARTVVRRFPVYDHAGQHERAWQVALPLLPNQSRLAQITERHLLVGGAGDVAMRLGYPEVALLYRSAAIQMIEQAGNPPNQTDLAVALRKRADCEIALGQTDRAIADLRKSATLDDSVEEADQRRLLEVRMQELTGRAFLQTHRFSIAIEAFTRALDLSKKDEFSTARASLFAQRAEAHLGAGNHAAFERDLRSALEQLHAEEEKILKTRRVGEGEELWSSYFSRFQETYRLLIRSLMDRSRNVEAFAWAERARAFEPLDLVLKLDFVPPRFRTLARAGQIDIAALQRELPPDTFLLEYAVLDDRTYTWILSRNDAISLKQTANRTDIDRWSQAILEAVRKHDAAALDAALLAPYDRLLAAPLSSINKLAGGSRARIVIIPDAAMYSLPFTALRDPKTERYLVQDTEVSIAPSALLYVFSLMRDQALPPERSALLIGDPHIDPRLIARLGLARLPRARTEVETIRAFYPRHETLIDDDATVFRFLERAPDYAVIHIAAHAVSDAQSPSQSFILLARTPNDNGAFSAEEMLTQLKLARTRLVILSACSSAGGTPVGAEGVAPLVRPLLATGVPAVIGSLWNVDDATAEPLLVSFHRHYQHGKSAAEALTAAQRELLSDSRPESGSVLAWASFQVIGHASSPFAPAHDTTKEKPP